MKNDKISISVVSAYLLVYTILAALEIWPQIILLMFAVSPLLMVWMVYSILKYGKYTGKTLGKDAEPGYSDFDK